MPIYDLAGGTSFRLPPSEAVIESNLLPFSCSLGSQKDTAFAEDTKNKSILVRHVKS